jgi:putative flippase GtrA
MGVRQQYPAVFSDPSSAHHIKHECLAYTIVHARYMHVHFVTPQKIVDIVLSMVYSSRGCALCVQPCRWRIAHSPWDTKDGRGVLGMERMGAKTLASRVNHTAAPGLFAGRDVDQHVLCRPTEPLALELVRYTIAGGLASLVDVGMLVVLTRGLGVYYLHAAAIAFGLGLLTSYMLSIAWVFHKRTWQNPCVELGLFTLIGGIGLFWCGVCMWFLTEYAHLHYLFSKMGSALVVFLWNFSHSTQFSGKEYHRSSKASRREDLQVEEPVACWDCSSFDFHSTLAGMLRAPLVGYEVVQMGEPAQKRLLAAFGMMEDLHHAQLPVDGVMGLIQHRARHRHLRILKDRIPARLLLLEPAPDAFPVGGSSRCRDVVDKTAQPLAQCKHAPLNL